MAGAPKGSFSWNFGPEDLIARGNSSLSLMKFISNFCSTVKLIPFVFYNKQAKYFLVGFY